jgi:hypothetical protein
VTARPTGRATGRARSCCANRGESQQLLQIGGGAGAMALSWRRCSADALLLYFWQSSSCWPVWVPQLAAVFEAVKG